MALSNSFSLPTFQFSLLNSQSDDMFYRIAVRINADSVWLSYAACELQHKFKLLLFPRSTVSFITTMDDADLALKGKESKWN